MIDHAELSLSVAQCVAVQDHIVTSTNGLYRPKEVLEALIPVLKGLLTPPIIQKKVAKKEREGFVLSRMIEVDNVHVLLM